MATLRKLATNGELSDRERKNFAILDTIRTKGPIARTEITKITGFNIVTVSNYIDHYIKEGLVAEEGYDTSSGGRKPMLVNLNQASAYVIGLGFDMTDMIGLITDLRGDIIFQIKRKKPSESGVALVENLMTMVTELIENSAVDRGKIKGIGFAVAGIIDRENRTMRWPGELGTPDTVVSVSLDTISNSFNIPVIVEHDADCAVFGEQWLALNPDYKHVIYMYSGVSCGILLNGQIYKGATGCAGELGILNPSALDSYDWECEQYGLGRWSMELGMLDHTRGLFEKHRDSAIFEGLDTPEEVTYMNIVEAARKKDELALSLLLKAGEHLGRKVAFLVNLFNPQAVVIGGGIERAGSTLLDPLKKTVREWAFEEATRGLKIIPAQLAENAVPLGAASLVIKNYFEQM